jgi:hypothetical protein
MTETPIAIIESQHETNPAYAAYGLRHWNNTPPVPLAGGNTPSDQEDDLEIEQFGPRHAKGARWFSMRRGGTPVALKME